MASTERPTTSAISLAHSQELAQAVQEVGMDRKVVQIVDETLGPHMTKLLASTILSGAQLLSTHADLRAGSGVAAIAKIEDDYKKDHRVLRHTMGSNPTHLTLLIGTEFRHVMAMSSLYFKLVDLVMGNDPRAAEKYLNSLLKYLAGPNPEVRPAHTRQRKEAKGWEGLRQSVLRLLAQGPAPVDMVAEMAQSAGFVMSKDLMTGLIMRDLGLTVFTYSEAKKKLAAVEPKIILKAKGSLDRPTNEAVRIAKVLAPKKAALVGAIAARDNAFSNVNAGPSFDPKARGANAEALQAAQKKVLTLSAQVNRLDAALTQAEHVELGAVRHSDAQVAALDLLRGTIGTLEDAVQSKHFIFQIAMTEGIRAMAIATKLKEREVIIQAMQEFEQRLLEAPKEYQSAIAKAVQETREAGILPEKPIEADYKVM